MKEQEIIDGIAKLIAEKGLYDVKPMLIEALKEHYGVSSMFFWKDGSGWSYCTEWDPKKPRGLWSAHNRELMDFDDLSRCLRGLAKNTDRLGGYSVIFNGQHCKDLDEIKRFALTKKLAGI